MRGVIAIGEKNVEMVANAASPYLFKQVFKEDFLLLIQKKDPDADLFVKMGFIMAKQAETDNIADLMKLDLTAFYTWLEDFNPLEVMNATAPMSEVYFGQIKTISNPKEKGA